MGAFSVLLLVTTMCDFRRRIFPPSVLYRGEITKSPERGFAHVGLHATRDEGGMQRGTGAGWSALGFFFRNRFLTVPRFSPSAFFLADSWSSLKLFEHGFIERDE